MSGAARIGQWRAGGAKAASVLLVLAALAACTSTARLGGEPEPVAATPPAEPLPSPPPPPQPPVDLAGKWRLSAAGSGACLMSFGNAPNAVDQGTIAPAGGCPANFFTSRKWTFEHNMLIIRDYKGQVLVELAFADGRFQGKDLKGTAMTLARP